LRVQAGKGPLSHQVIELAATGQLGMAAAGQILQQRTSPISEIAKSSRSQNDLRRDALAG
jgi:hypothetical protein